MQFSLDYHRNWLEKRVVAVVKLPNKNPIEIDGELKAVHQRGIMIRPRGRQANEMIETAYLTDIALYDDKPQPIKRKEMNQILYGSIRAHLADKHGVSLAMLNEEGFTEDQAYDYHLKHHRETELSHIHTD